MFGISMCVHSYTHTHTYIQIYRCSMLVRCFLVCLKCSSFFHEVCRAAICAGIQRLFGFRLGSEHGLDGENILGRRVSGDARGPLGIPGHPGAWRTQVDDEDNVDDDDDDDSDDGDDDGL